MSYLTCEVCERWAYESQISFTETQKVRNGYDNRKKFPLPRKARSSIKWVKQSLQDPQIGGASSYLLFLAEDKVKMFYSNHLYVMKFSIEFLSKF
jgi:hypothetical protein